MKPCCEKPENRVLVPDDRPDVQVEKCVVCGCHHIEMIADPGRLGVRGASL